MRIYRDLRHENAACVDGVARNIQCTQQVENLTRNIISRRADFGRQVKHVQLLIKREQSAFVLDS